MRRYNDGGAVYRRKDNMDNAGIPHCSRGDSPSVGGMSAVNSRLGFLEPVEEPVEKATAS